MRPRPTLGTFLQHLRTEVATHLLVTGRRPVYVLVSEDMWPESLGAPTQTFIEGVRVVPVAVTGASIRYRAVAS